MKATVSQKAFAEAMTATSSVTASRTPKHILQYVYIEAADRVMRLCATDQEVGLRFEIPEVEIETAGNAVVPAGTLWHIVCESADETVSTEVVKDVGHSR